jgi:glutamine amidotransferase/cyclase
VKTIMITLLDYGAGNVRSIINAIESLGYPVRVVAKPQDIVAAAKLVFPGVGSFGHMMRYLHSKDYVAPLKAYLRSGRPFLGICMGLQALFEGSDESPEIEGLGIISGRVRRFEVSLPVPHIGWNGVRQHKASPLFEGLRGEERFYFVHSYHAVPADAAAVLTRTDYGDAFVSSVARDNITATQFHPEKSGPAGLKLLENFLSGGRGQSRRPLVVGPTRLAKRIIACLDVRANDQGDLVVTKGDRYDVRESGAVRNLGKPVELARRYYEEGADEITFLNITAFRDFPLADQPMLEVLRRTSRNVFVPLTIGGGIRDYIDRAGRHNSALEVAHAYFRSGADKVSIGSDAVGIVEAHLQGGGVAGASSIEQIARVYGSQAVVVSIDPRRVYVKSPDAVGHHVIATAHPGPEGQRYCWYQCTVKGGREGRPLDAVTLAQACEKLGAGEILLNCIDRDGTNLGFDLELINAVKEAVSIPVIASSGAGSAEHFFEVFTRTGADAALAAGIFHRREVPIDAVKSHLQGRVAVRLSAE